MLHPRQLCQYVSTPRRWSKLEFLIQSCSAKYFHLVTYRNWDDYKARLDGTAISYIGTFLPCFQITISPAVPLHPRNCSLVTLGIGDDVRAELKFKESFPKCHFVGADPHPINGKVYASKLGGRYVPTAVGSENGILKMSTKDADGHYRFHNVSTKEFLAFLLHDVKQTLIDQLWMDNEGPEYLILDKYTHPTTSEAVFPLLPFSTAPGRVRDD